MNSYEVKKYIKIILLLLAFFIGGITLYLSQRLARKMGEEEKKKLEIWAEAERILNDPEADGDFSFHLKVIQSNTTIPAIVVDEHGEIIQSINLDTQKAKSKTFLKQKLADFKLEHEPILVPIDKNIEHKVYFGESSLLRQLRYYPYYVLGVVALFILVSYFAFSFSRSAEQNQVWVGLAKETAHQLGTPISSLMGWIDYLELDLGNLPNNAGDEMRKDIRRLDIITERFSKIGSEPVLRPTEINKAIQGAMDYMLMRVGKNVEAELKLYPAPVMVDLNVNLFNWVIENLVKNSIDAMDGKGKLSLRVIHKHGQVYIDMSDTGKGIARNRFQTIFKPGYTTKKRGWGLGLSLAKRIIRDYHKGQILVKESIPFVRTTFRIIMSESKQ